MKIGIVALFLVCWLTLGSSEQQGEPKSSRWGGVSMKLTDVKQLVFLKDQLVFQKDQRAEPFPQLFCKNCYDGVEASVVVIEMDEGLKFEKEKWLHQFATDFEFENHNVWIDNFDIFCMEADSTGESIVAGSCRLEYDLFLEPIEDYTMFDPATNLCDKEEFCDGYSFSCPADETRFHKSESIVGVSCDDIFNHCNCDPWEDEHMCLPQPLVPVDTAGSVAVIPCDPWEDEHMCSPRPLIPIDTRCRKGLGICDEEQSEKPLEWSQVPSFVSWFFEMPSSAKVIWFLLLLYPLLLCICGTWVVMGALTSFVENVLTRVLLWFHQDDAMPHQHTPTITPPSLNSLVYQVALNESDSSSRPRYGQAQNSQKPSKMDNRPLTREERALMQRITGHSDAILDEMRVGTLPETNDDSVIDSDSSFEKEEDVLPENEIEE